MIKVCKKCGKEFKTVSSKRKYCSKECSYSDRQHMVKICPICGKEFQPEKRNTKYCSKECSIKSQIKQKLVVCEYCGKEFLKKQTEIDRNNHNFCSRDCYYKSTKNKFIIKEFDTYAEIYVTNRQNKVFKILIDLDDIELAKNCTFSLRYDETIKGYYVSSRYNKRHYAFHRLIMKCPKDMQIDHINHNTLDNRKQNLRICTAKVNNQNKIINKSKSSGYRNIYWKPKLNKWEVGLCSDYKKIYIGVFAKLDDAIQAAKQARQKYFKYGVQ